MNGKIKSAGVTVLIVPILILAVIVYLLFIKSGANNSKNIAGSNLQQPYSQPVSLDINKNNDLLYAVEDGNPAIDIYDINKLNLAGTLESGYSSADLSGTKIYVDSSINKAFIYGETSARKQFSVFDLGFKTKVCDGELGLIAFPDESRDEIVDVFGSNGKFQIKTFNYACKNIFSFSIPSNIVTNSSDGEIGVLDSVSGDIKIYNITTGQLVDTLFIGNISLKHNMRLNSDWFVGVLNETGKFGIAVYNRQTKSLSKTYFSGSDSMSPILSQNYYFLPSHTSTGNIISEIDLDTSKVIATYALNSDEVAYSVNLGNNYLYAISKNKKIRKISSSVINSSGLNAPSQNSGKAVIYATIVSHNEDSSPRFDYLNTQAGYVNVRNYLVQMASFVKSIGASWDYEAEWRFLQAAEKYETGSVLSNTDNKNILRYFKEDLGFQIDPHSHEDSGYNYADVAYLINQLGVVPSQVVGGFVFASDNPSQVDWEKFRNPLAGNVYPYSWSANALWGAGTMGHVGNEEKKSGIWRPKSESDFFTDDPNSNLINIGTCDNIDSLVNSIYISKTAPSNKLYNVVVFFSDDYLADPTKFSDYEAQINKINAYVKEGYVKWATFDDIVNTWRDNYGSQPNMFDCGSSASVGSTGSQQSSVHSAPSGTGYCGDGICDVIERTSGKCPQDCNK